MKTQLSIAEIMPMFTQSSRIRDVVFPLCTVSAGETEWNFESFLGSAFAIGSRSYALTAAHVLRNRSNVAGMFCDENADWLAFSIDQIEFHPVEDICIFRLVGIQLNSYLCLHNQFENAGQEYQQFAYPDDMMYELKQGGKASGRPDMIYLKGYIRRRTNHPIPSLRGTAFFETSEIAGTGASGSPILKIVSGQRLWKVLGIYVGEKLNDRGTSVSYVLREDAFRDWTPKCLGRSILAESQSERSSGSPL